MNNSDMLSLDVFGATTAIFPTDGQGSGVTTGNNSTSTAATTTFTATTASDSAYDTSTKPARQATAGCLITTSGGYYGMIDSLTSALGGVITVSHWMHKNPSKVGGVPVSGTETFTLWTAPKGISGAPQNSMMGRIASMEIFRIQAVEVLTAVGHLQLVDAAGNVLYPNGAGAGIQLPFSAAGVPLSIDWGPQGRVFPGIVGFKLSSATDATVSVLWRPRSWSPTKRRYPLG